MKKLCVLLLAILLVAGMVYSQEETSEKPPRQRTEFFDLEVTWGFPIHWTNANHDDHLTSATPDPLANEKTATANSSYGIGMNFNLGRVFGLHLDMDFFFGAKLPGFSQTRSDYNSLFGADAFFGLQFNLFNNNIFRIPFGIGGHFYYFLEDVWVYDFKYDPAGGTTSTSNGQWIKRMDMQFGPAVFLGFQLHFSGGVYLFSRVTAAIDFIRIHDQIGIYEDPITGNFIYKGKDSEMDMWVYSWNVKPSIGVGIKF